MSTPQIRLATAADVPALVPLFQAYMRETYDAPWHGSAESLERDALGHRCTLHVAVDAHRSVSGFIGWTSSYDLHHCLAGADVLDLYVSPGDRGRGLALALACAAAEAVARGGGTYLKGGAVEGGTGRRLYARLAVCWPNGDCYVSGRAFRRLAALTGVPLRTMIRDLPPRAWNHEA
jgi:GNAT superfamily N-acetyltransferase